MWQQEKVLTITHAASTDRLVREPEGKKALRLGSEHRRSARVGAALRVECVWTTESFRKPESGSFIGVWTADASAQAWYPNEAVLLIFAAH